MEMEQNIGILDVALKLLQKGVSIVPVHNNRPTVDLEEFQRRKPTVEEVTQWFSDPQNDQIGLICGKVSNGLVYMETKHNFGELAGKILHNFFFCPDAEGKLENMTIGKENEQFQITLVVSGFIIPQISYEYIDDLFEYLSYLKEMSLATLIESIGAWIAILKFWKFADKFQQYYEISTNKNRLILAFSGFLRKYLNLSLTQAIAILEFALMKKDITLPKLDETIKGEILPKTKYIDFVYMLSPEYVQVDKWFKELGAEQLEHELLDLISEE